MTFRRQILTITIILLTLSAFAQRKTAYVSGTVVDENENLLAVIGLEHRVACNQHIRSCCNDAWCVFKRDSYIDLVCMMSVNPGLEEETGATAIF